MPTVGWIQETAIDLFLERGFSAQEKRFTTKFKCRECPMEFSSLSGLNQHERLHPVANPTLTIEGREVTGGNFKLTRSVDSKDVVLHFVDEIELNGVVLENADELSVQLSSVKKGFFDIKLSRQGNLDDAIQKYVEQKHAEQHGWDEDNRLERNPGMSAKLQSECERAKINLSTHPKTTIFVPNYYVGEGDDSEIACWITREELEAISQRLIRQGINEIDALLADNQADIDRQTIALCLATGGMVNMPLIKRQLSELFGIASLKISKKGDRIISEGAAWIASDELKLTLSKPFELLEARNSMLTIIPEGTLLPTRGNSISYPQSMYCTDPRDGNALASFKRPQMVGKTAAADPRTSYGELVIPINPDFPPLEERIELEISIDENLIVHISGVGGDRQLQRSTEFYDLEFGLATTTVLPDSKKKRLKLKGEKKLPYGLMIRANVTPDKESWELVPGELLKSYNDEHPFLRKTLTEQQRTEFVRYQPCSICGARWGKRCCSGVI
ncbi:Hsp70 family protein [Hafnia paralvei]|uniref:C2H2-type domain-containing protein n=1 Tax=Hafnia paralvei TaxID=546367 RepID=A0A4Q9ETM3_9GAMM|nr:Hsp70 family protein [Hafnia paralvei]TBM31479.1 hypothetical protein EYY89_03070 [Hafnia paralvei]